MLDSEARRFRADFVFSRRAFVCRLPDVACRAPPVTRAGLFTRYALRPRALFRSFFSMLI